jgi:hypothetical protein
MTSTIAIATLMLRALLGPLFQMFPFPGPGMHQAAAPSGIAFVAGQVAYRSVVESTTFTLTFPSNVTAGNLVAVGIQTTGSSIISVIGGGVETFVPVTSIYIPSYASVPNLQYYYFANSSGGYSSIIVTQDSSADYGTGIASEWHGAALSSVVDGAQVNVHGADAFSVGPIGPTSAADLVLVFAVNTNDNFTGLTGGFSSLYSDTAEHKALLYKIQSSSGSATCGASTTYYWGAIMAAFKP